MSYDRSKCPFSKQRQGSFYPTSWLPYSTTGMSTSRPFTRYTHPSPPPKPLPWRHSQHTTQRKQSGHSKPQTSVAKAPQTQPPTRFVPPPQHDLKRQKHILPPREPTRPKQHMGLKRPPADTAPRPTAKKSDSTKKPPFNKRGTATVSTSAGKPHSQASRKHSRAASVHLGSSSVRTPHTGTPSIFTVTPSKQHTAVPSTRFTLVKHTKDKSSYMPPRPKARQPPQPPPQKTNNISRKQCTDNRPNRDNRNNKPRTPTETLSARHSKMRYNESTQARDYHEYHQYTWNDELCHTSRQHIQYAYDRHSPAKSRFPTRHNLSHKELAKLLTNDTHGINNLVPTKPIPNHNSSDYDVIDSKHFQQCILPNEDDSQRLHFHNCFSSPEQLRQLGYLSNADSAVTKSLNQVLVLEAYRSSWRFKHADNSTGAQHPTETSLGFITTDHPLIRTICACSQHYFDLCIIGWLAYLPNLTIHHMLYENPQPSIHVTVDPVHINHVEHPLPLAPLRAQFPTFDDHLLPLPPKPPTDDKYRIVFTTVPYDRPCAHGCAWTHITFANLTQPGTLLYVTPIASNQLTNTSAIPGPAFSNHYSRDPQHLDRLPAQCGIPVREHTTHSYYKARAHGEPLITRSLHNVVATAARNVLLKLIVVMTEPNNPAPTFHTHGNMQDADTIIPQLKQLLGDYFEIIDHPWPIPQLHTWIGNAPFLPSIEQHPVPPYPTGIQALIAEVHTLTPDNLSRVHNVLQFPTRSYPHPTYELNSLLDTAIDVATLHTHRSTHFNKEGLPSLLFTIAMLKQSQSPDKHPLWDPTNTAPNPKTLQSHVLDVLDLAVRQNPTPYHADDPAGQPHADDGSKWHSLDQSRHGYRATRFCTYCHQRVTHNARCDTCHNLYEERYADGSTTTNRIHRTLPRWDTGNFVPLVCNDQPPHLRHISLYTARCQAMGIQHLTCNFTAHHAVTHPDANQVIIAVHSHIITAINELQLPTRGAIAKTCNWHLTALRDHSYVVGQLDEFLAAHHYSFTTAQDRVATTRDATLHLLLLHVLQSLWSGSINDLPSTLTCRDACITAFACIEGFRHYYTVSGPTTDPASSN